MLIFNSRTIHFAQNPFKKRKNPNTRICVYICMFPKSFASKKRH